MARPLWSFSEISRILTHGSYEDIDSMLSDEFAKQQVRSMEKALVGGLLLINDRKNIVQLISHHDILKPSDWDLEMIVSSRLGLDNCLADILLLGGIDFGVIENESKRVCMTLLRAYRKLVSDLMIENVKRALQDTVSTDYG